MASTLFPIDLPLRRFIDFEAEGYPCPVTGVIYSGEDPPVCGMPLGGIDTGCLDVGAGGLLGIASIFNSLAPRRGPLNVPFMGMRIEGRTFLMSSCGMPGVEPARVAYWGHYPVLDMECEWPTAPVAAGIRAWTPFIPGDVAASNVPGAVFEVHLRNAGGKPVAGTLAFSFPGFDRSEAGYIVVFRRPVQEPLQGAYLGIGQFTVGQGHPNPQEPSYVLGVVGGESVRIADTFGWNASAWRAMDQMPAPKTEDHDNSGVTVLTDFALAAGETRVIRFVLAWYASAWHANGCRTAGGSVFHHMYARRFANALDVAGYLAGDHEALLGRILAWQAVVYGERSLPGWLRDSLINILHLVTETSVWAQAEPPIGDWCRQEDGLFGLNECPRGCPQIECIPCSLYGNLPLVYFFPQLALSTLRGYKAYQFEDGRPPWVFGGITVGTGFYDVAAPRKGYQTALNGCCLVELVDKMWLRTGDDGLLAEFYDSCKRATVFTMNLRPEYGDKQVISMPAGNEGTEWFEAPEPGWAGMATHVGGIRLAHLLMMERMARKMNDGAFAARCREWLEAGAKAMEDYLWAGDYYLNFHEPETGKRSEEVFGYQLDGQWISQFHGAGDAFPPKRAAATLETIRRCNVALSKTGAVNYARHDGTPAPVGGYGTYSYFPPELLMLAMTYMYNGEREFGIELARRCWENIVCAQGLTWDQPNFFRGDLDTGERTFGNDYYQNMMLWSLPAALAGTDLAAPCRPGGLVDRMVEAGRAGGPPAGR